MAEFAGDAVFVVSFGKHVSNDVLGGCFECVEAATKAVHAVEFCSECAVEYGCAYEGVCVWVACEP